MKISVRLVVTAEGQEPKQRFILSSAEGKNLDDQTFVWNYLKMRISAEGLAYGMSPSGVITMRIPSAKLDRHLAQRIYDAAQDALKQI